MRNIQSRDQDQYAVEKEACFKENAFESKIDFPEQAAKEEEILVAVEWGESVGDVLKSLFSICARRYAGHPDEPW